MEDFVPYELVVKLTEKGFDWETRDIYERNPLACRYEDYPKPTISQVLKWLRKEKKIHIQILFICPPDKWEYITIKMTNLELRGIVASFTSWEQAALAGIEYVSDNLI